MILKIEMAGFASTSYFIISKNQWNRSIIRGRKKFFRKFFPQNFFRFFWIFRFSFPHHWLLDKKKSFVRNLKIYPISRCLMIFSKVKYWNIITPYSRIWKNQWNWTIIRCTKSDLKIFISQIFFFDFLGF